jgi:spermidine synthase
MFKPLESEFKKYYLDDSGTGHVFFREKLLFSQMSKYQSIEISELDKLGKVLVLDKIIQLSSLDCDAYHESFAHIPISLIKEPKSALILGGGDGILAKEVLKYNNCSVDLVDIDSIVVEASKVHLTDLHHNCFDNDRLTYHESDALDFIKNTDKKYDIIYADITDPHPQSPSKSLLSHEAIKLYKSRLKAGGVFTAQTDNPHISPHHRLDLMATCRKSFKHVDDFGIVALTLSGLFSFVVASNKKFKPRMTRVEKNWLNEKRLKGCLNILEMI